MTRETLTRWAAILFIALLLNTAYIAAFASPTVFYMANVLMHLTLGVLLVAALPLIWRRFRVAAGHGFGWRLAVFGAAAGRGFAWRRAVLLGADRQAPHSKVYYFGRNT